jgi:predicted tellurium resistance membrane protein TerC
MLGLLTDPHAWAALITLTVLEIVLGIDNVIFISILVSRLPQKWRKLARQIGLSLALVFRIALLLMLTWIMRLTEPIFEVFGNSVSWRDLILIGGGLFLIAKGVHEIHAEVEGRYERGSRTPSMATASFGWAIVQLIAIDMIFSLDSIITAIGMAQHIEVMVAAIVIAVAVMYFASGPVSDFVSRYPTTKMLALAFLLLIGVALVADGFEFHIPRGYIYFAMAFAASVEAFNIMALRKRTRRGRRRTRRA